MNNKKMNSQVVCAEKSARRIDGAKQMAHTQKSGAGARIFRASLFKEAVSLASARDEYRDATSNRP